MISLSYAAGLFLWAVFLAQLGACLTGSQAVRRVQFAGGYDDLVKIIRKFMIRF